MSGKERSPTKATRGLSHFVMGAIFCGIAWTGCATAPMGEPPPRVELRRFSVLAPQGPEWVSLQSSPRSHSWCKRLKDRAGRPASRLHTFCASATADDVKLERPGDLETYVRVSMTGGRFRLVEMSIVENRSSEAHCVESDWTVEERDNPRGPGVVFLLVGRSIFCEHPSIQGLLVWAQYSERSPRSEQSLLTDVERQEGETFLHTIQFKK